MFYQETKTLKAAAIGTIMPWTGGLTSIPRGWVICDGQSLRARDYPLLAQTIGDTYNAGTSDFAGNFPGYIGSIKLPNLNGKVLMDIEESYFASSESGGTGRPADLDPQALLLLDALIGDNEDLGVSTIFTNVYIDVVFSIPDSDRSGYLGTIAGNTLINGEDFKTIYIGPRKLGRKHIKRHTHSGTYETLDNANPSQPGNGVVPYEDISYTLRFQATDNTGDNENAGDTFYFGWANDESYRQDHDPPFSGDTPIYGNVNIPGLMGGTDWDGSQASQGLQVVSWPTGADTISGYNNGEPGKVMAKIASESPPVNLKPASVLRTPITEFFLNTPAKTSGQYISGSIPFGVGGNTVSIPEGFTNYYTTSDATVRNTLMSHQALNFTSTSPSDFIQAHVHDDFDVTFDSTRMRPQSNLSAVVNLPVTTTLDNASNRNALQVDFNIQQPTMSCIYIIRAY